MIKDLIFNLKPLIRVTLLMSFPLFILLVLGFFIMPYNRGYLKEVLAFGLITLIFVCLSLLINNKRAKLLFLQISTLILCVLLFIKISFYINYGVKISASALFVIFETNDIEAYDFIINYFNYKLIGLAVLLFVFLIVSFLIFRSKTILTYKSPKWLKVAALVLVPLSAFCIQWKLFNENLLLTSINSYEDYSIAKANLKDALAKQDTKYIKEVNGLDTEQTYVVIVGESTSNWHMQLYGYERETNPLLYEIKDELLVFDSVITPNLHTIIALDKILTFSDFHDVNKKNNASVVQLANKAGFETFWISNQKPIGFNESIPTIIGNAAKNKNFIASGNLNYDIYDESLLPYLDQALNNTAKKKIIFVHLSGTHIRYVRRYPKSFDVFKDENNTAFKHSDSKQTINEYDNAILYNDFVVREIIERVKNKNENSYVVYFSDHGDDVYDTFDYVGHNEYHGTRPMYEIPFIIWFSEKYKETNASLFNIENLTKRPYLLEDFIHSFSEISNITFDKFNPEKSIFNPEFKKKVRLVTKGDYDKK